MHITDDADSVARLRKDWDRTLPGVPLVIVETPFRSLVTPFLHYLDVMAPTEEGVITIVVLPEYVPSHWWDRLLYNQTANRVKRALVGSTRHGRRGRPVREGAPSRDAGRMRLGRSGS